MQDNSLYFVARNNTVVVKSEGEFIEHTFETEGYNYLVNNNLDDYQFEFITNNNKFISYKYLAQTILKAEIDGQTIYEVPLEDAIIDIYYEEAEPSYIRIRVDETIYAEENLFNNIIVEFHYRGENKYYNYFVDVYLKDLDESTYDVNIYFDNYLSEIINASVNLTINKYNNYLSVSEEIKIFKRNDYLLYVDGKLFDDNSTNFYDKVSTIEKIYLKNEYYEVIKTFDTIEEVLAYQQKNNIIFLEVSTDRNLDQAAIKQYLSEKIVYQMYLTDKEFNRYIDLENFAVFTENFKIIISDEIIIKTKNSIANFNFNDDLSNILNKQELNLIQVLKFLKAYFNDEIKLNVIPNEGLVDDNNNRISIGYNHIIVYVNDISEDISNIVDDVPNFNYYDSEGFNYELVINDSKYLLKTNSIAGINEFLSLRYKGFEIYLDDKFEERLELLPDNDTTLYINTDVKYIISAYSSSNNQLINESNLLDEIIITVHYGDYTSEDVSLGSLSDFEYSYEINDPNILTNINVRVNHITFKVYVYMYKIVDDDRLVDAIIDYNTNVYFYLSEMEKMVNSFRRIERIYFSNEQKHYYSVEDFLEDIDNFNDEIINLQISTKYDEINLNAIFDEIRSDVIKIYQNEKEYYIDFVNNQIIGERFKIYLNENSYEIYTDLSYVKVPKERFNVISFVESGRNIYEDRKAIIAIFNLIKLLNNEYISFYESSNKFYFTFDENDESSTYLYFNYQYEIVNRNDQNKIFKIFSYEGQIPNVEFNAGANTYIYKNNIDDNEVIYISDQYHNNYVYIDTIIEGIYYDDQFSNKVFRNNNEDSTLYVKYLQEIPISISVEFSLDDNYFLVSELYSRLAIRVNYENGKSKYIRLEDIPQEEIKLEYEIKGFLEKTKIKLSYFNLETEFNLYLSEEKPDENIVTVRKNKTYFVEKNALFDFLNSFDQTFGSYQYDLLVNNIWIEERFELDDLIAYVNDVDGNIEISIIITNKPILEIVEGLATKDYLEVFDSKGDKAYSYDLKTKTFKTSLFKMQEIEEGIFAIVSIKGNQNVSIGDSGLSFLENLFKKEDINKLYSMIELYRLLYGHYDSVSEYYNQHQFEYFNFYSRYIRVELRSDYNYDEVKLVLEFNNYYIHNE